MSTPALPEVFGNYALGDFVEVTAPAAISWYPQTPAWGWLAAAIAGYLLYRGWLALRRWYRNRYRREAAARLDKLANNHNSTTLVGEVNRLLKLVAMVAFSREQVARLSGDEWVHFLNSHCENTPFSPEQGRLLALAGYTGTALDPDRGAQLLAASRAWVWAHENPHNV